MQITTHTDYALRLLIYLAISTENKNPTVQDIAQHFDISSNHLAKVVQKLVQQNYVISRRGRGGGLELARPASDISIAEVVLDNENMQLLECFGNDCKCMIEPACSLYGVMAKAQQAFLAVLEQYKLSDMTKNKNKLMALLNIE